MASFLRDGSHIIVTSPDQVVNTSQTNDAPTTLEAASLHFSERDGKLMDRVAALRRKLGELEDTRSSDDGSTLGETDPYFNILADGLQEILGAQVCMVSRRLDKSPTLGHIKGAERLGCEGAELEAVVMTAAADVMEDGKAVVFNQANYSAYDCPCALMRHDRSVLVPSHATTTFPNNPNFALFTPFPDAYLGVPLIMSGTNIGHLACMWTAKGLSKSLLSWAQREVIMNLFCEGIGRHILAVGSFGKARLRDIADGTLLGADDGMAITDMASFASKLSHEIRTPLQGVIGLLDVLYASLPETTEESSSLSTIIRTIQSSGSNLLDLINNFREVCEPGTPAIKGPPTVPTPRSSSITSLAPADAQTSGAAPPAESGAAETGPTAASRPESTAQKAKRTFQESFSEQSTPPPQMLFKKQRRRSPLPSDADGIYDRPFESEEFRAEEDIQKVVREAIYKHKLMSHWRQGLIDASPTGEQQSRSNDCADGSCVLERPVIAQTDVPATWSIEDDLPRTFLIDRPRVMNMLDKLLSNALKFTKSGSVHLSARRGPPTGEPSVIFSVRDTGVGIDPQQRHLLFKAFSQIDSRSLQRDHDGAGLGLVLTRKWCRAMGGDCWCEFSEPGKGSEFRIQLPLVEFCVLPADHPSRRLSETPFNETRRLSLPDVKKQAELARAELAHSREVAADRTESGMAPPAPTTPTKASKQSAETQDSTTSTAVTTRPALARKPSTRPQGFDTQLARKHPLKIMVVEDNPVNRRMATVMLSKLGYPLQEMLVCEHGLEALQTMQKLRDRDERVDLILMDICMPVMNGLEASRRINGLFPDPDEQAPATSGPPAEVDPATGVHIAMQQKLTHSNNVPPQILAVTADATRDNLLKTAETGMAGYILKPFTIKQVEAAIISLFA
ncbi:hypothetical protein PYCC9005_002706 [Savitreella phatthalungensis]